VGWLIDDIAILSSTTIRVCDDVVLSGGTGPACSPSAEWPAWCSTKPLRKLRRLAPLEPLFRHVPGIAMRGAGGDPGLIGLVVMYRLFRRSAQEIDDAPSPPP
jgi:hypothetical protein